MTDRSKNDENGNTAEKRGRGRPPSTGAREALLSAGLAAMHTRGYGATGVADIVAQAGTPKGLFYSHFPSKQRFALEIVDAFAARVLANLDRHLDDPGEPSPLARLRGYFDARIAAYDTGGCARGCLLGNFGLELSDQDAEIRARVAARLAELTARIAGCLEAAQRAGEIRRDRPAPALARVLLAGWEGALLAMRVGQSTAPLREFVDLLVGDLLHPAPLATQEGASR